MPYLVRIAAFLALLVGLPCCGSGPVATPVAVYQEQQRNENSDHLGSDEELLKEIVELSQVTKNHVFTEEFGAAEYKVGPDDVLEITSWEGTRPEKFEITVRQDGRISYSFLDDIAVMGLTAKQIDDALTERLTKYLRKVRIDVAIINFQSKSALLSGEINILQTGKSGPGKYPLKGKTSIVDFIVSAGGATNNSDLRNVELARGGKRYTVNLYAAMYRGDMSQNIIIDDGDLVTVPKLRVLGERVYVFGEVRNEGIYPFEESHDLLAAIGKAGGCKSTAVRKDIKIIRGYGRGKPVVLAANLQNLLEQGDTSQNLPLINGDVVYVPRTIVGDINEFILNTTPLLEYLFYPQRYGDAY